MHFLLQSPRALPFAGPEHEVLAAVEQYERTTSTALLLQRWQTILDAWPEDFIIHLARRPVVELYMRIHEPFQLRTKIQEPGSWKEPEGRAYVPMDVDHIGGRLLLPRTCMDIPLRPRRGIEVTYVAGYGDHASSLPTFYRRVAADQEDCMTTAYPLAWPPSWPRTPAPHRRNGKGQWGHKGKPWTFDAARRALADELERHDAGNVILSTNYELRIDGAPKAGGKVPKDVGIAVYFTRKGRQVVMARDAFDRAEENIRSLTLALEAMRAIDRHGGSLMLDRAFEGFMAIGNGARPWREVFGLSGNPTASEINHRYRKLAAERHPDLGGSDVMMAELNAARDEALRELA